MVFGWAQYCKWLHYLLSQQNLSSGGLWRSLIRTLLQRIHKTASGRVELGGSCLPVTSTQVVLMLLIFLYPMPKEGKAQAQHKINMALEKTLSMYQH